MSSHLNGKCPWHVFQLIGNEWTHRHGLLFWMSFLSFSHSQTSSYLPYVWINLLISLIASHPPQDSSESLETLWYAQKLRNLLTAYFTQIFFLMLYSLQLFWWLMVDEFQKHMIKDNRYCSYIKQIVWTWKWCLIALFLWCNILTSDTQKRGMIM